LAALTLSIGMAAAAEATTALNLREQPGTQGAVIGVIPEGAQVETMGCQSGWCQVSYRGRRGFASVAYLSKDGRGAFNAASKPAYVPVKPDVQPYAYETTRTYVRPTPYAYEGSPYTYYGASPTYEPSPSYYEASPYSYEGGRDTPWGWE